jgi:hypothetical protein
VRLPLSFFVVAPATFFSMALATACSPVLEVSAGQASGQGEQDGGASVPVFGGGDGGTTASTSFQWMNPTPTGEAIYGIFGTADDDIWLAGAEGTIQHWDGNHLTLAYQGVATQSFYAVWASGPSDVWVGGDGNGGAALVHWDGQTWSTDYSVNGMGQALPIYAIGGSAAGDVWLLGSTGNTFHWDGTGWTLGRNADAQAPNDFLPAYVLRSVWSAGPHDSWAVGDDGVLLRSVAGSTADSAPSWTSESNGADPLSLGTGDDFIGVSGSAANDVWAVTCNAATQQVGFFHWDGGAWKAYPAQPAACSPAESSPAHESGRISVSSPNRALVMGRGYSFEWDGVAWSPFASSVAAASLWSDGSGAPYAIVDIATVDGNASLSGNGNQVDRASVGSHDWAPVLPGMRDWLQYVSVTTGGSVWATTYEDSAQEAVMHWTDSGWTAAPKPKSADFSGILAIADDDVWVVGSQAVEHWNGQTWADQTPAGVQYPMGPLHRDASGAIWLAIQSPNAMIERLVGGVWTAMTPPEPKATFRAISSTSADDVWMSGQDQNGDTIVAHWDGLALTEAYRVPSSSEEASGGTSIFALSPSDVWLSGSPPQHWDGTTWKPLADTDVYVTQIWADASDDVWMLGANWQAGIHHYDGQTLTLAFTSSMNVLGLSGNDSQLWVVGESGLTLRKMLPSQVVTK